MLKTFTNLVACEHCDTTYARTPLAPGEVARCGQCGAVLYRSSPLDIDRWLALTVAAAITFVIANVYPVVKISLQGLRSQATLWESAAALAHGPAAPIAVPTALAIIVVPFMQISLLLWVLGHAHFGRRAPGFRLAMRMLVGLRPWSMVEVALLGILVAVIKLSSMLEVAPGPGIWATTILMILITLVANRDVHWLWDFTDSARPPAEVAS
ncbi:MAG TPA: paraquat-inducible protein A [Alicycliphilus sp.]|nr:paraquat-inducible protein A [Alicycliphilus sp.]